MVVNRTKETKTHPFSLSLSLFHLPKDATVGSALDLFGGDLRYADVVDWHRRSLGGAREEGS